MKANKRKIVNHLKGSKPFSYRKYSFQKVEELSIYIIKKFESNDANSGYLTSSHRSKDGSVKTDIFDGASVTFKKTGHISVFLNIGGQINANVNLDYDCIVLLDNKFQPLQ